MRRFLRFAAVGGGAVLATLMLSAAIATDAPAPDVTPVPTPGAAPAPVATPPEFDATSWVLMDYSSGRILAAKDPHLEVEPASLTKVMTDYVVSSEIDAGRVHLDDDVLISENAWREGGASTDGSTSFLELDSKVPLEDLMKGLIVQSGNDAAIALAEHVAGSESSFVSLMNAQAKHLGMQNTHYENVSGYPAENHYSSAYDTALLSRALISQYPEDYQLSSLKEFTWNGIKQYNRNTLLWRDPTVDGIKTGHTAKAGYCLAASALRDGHRLIAVVMGAKSSRARADHVQALLNYGYRFFKFRDLYRGGEEITSVRVWKGNHKHVGVALGSDLSVALETADYDRMQARVYLPEPLMAPLEKGTQVGELVVTLGDDVLTKAPVFVQEDVARGGFFSRLWDALLLLFKGDGQPSTVAADPAQ